MNDKSPSEVLKEVLAKAIEERRGQAPTTGDSLSNTTIDGLITLADGHVATTESALLSGAELMKSSFLVSQTGYALLSEEEDSSKLSYDNTTRAIILHQPEGHPFGLPARLLLIPKDLSAFLDLAWNCLAPWFGPELATEILNSPEVKKKMEEHLEREREAKDE